LLGFSLLVTLLPEEIFLVVTVEQDGVACGDALAAVEEVPSRWLLSFSDLGFLTEAIRTSESFLHGFNLFGGWTTAGGFNPGLEEVSICTIARPNGNCHCSAGSPTVVSRVGGRRSGRKGFSFGNGPGY